ncbi:hypothetical protein RFI_00565 [Reticulomyxa filosa]|uniref:Uncharacterized protein n=1 Tax=Reticulomyxa filosa TaxID=46433 RepID=X6PEG6_RETFI|nr:hypothetical protein RFI_00565 [Reticulomyxa filosa]|eukprot:ETO36498.1 hypothetical protein RFI_00565 [Reticulomyxa filosa]
MNTTTNKKKNAAVSSRCKGQQSQNQRARGKDYVGKQKKNWKILLHGLAEEQKLRGQIDRIYHYLLNGMRLFLFIYLFFKHNNNTCKYN